MQSSHCCKICAFYSLHGLVITCFLQIYFYLVRNKHSVYLNSYSSLLLCVTYHNKFCFSNQTSTLFGSPTLRYLVFQPTRSGRKWSHISSQSSLHSLILKEKKWLVEYFKKYQNIWFGLQFWESYSCKTLLLPECNDIIAIFSSNIFRQESGLSIKIKYAYFI